MHLTMMRTRNLGPGLHLTSGRKNSPSPHRTVNQTKGFGVYLLVDGVSTQILARNLQPKDIIGIAFDGVEGSVNFDLNSIDLEVHYTHPALPVLRSDATGQLAQASRPYIRTNPTVGWLIILWHSAWKVAIFLGDLLHI